jgi:hypothetical protein
MVLTTKSETQVSNEVVSLGRPHFNLCVRTVQPTCNPHRFGLKFIFQPTKNMHRINYWNVSKHCHTRFVFQDLVFLFVVTSNYEPNNAQLSLFVCVNNSLIIFLSSFLLMCVCVCVCVCVSSVQMLETILELFRNNYWQKNVQRNVLVLVICCSSRLFSSIQMR